MEHGTDYISLRRLIEYHNQIALPAIEDAVGTAGKVDDVGYYSDEQWTSLLGTGDDAKKAILSLADGSTPGLIKSIKMGPEDPTLGQATATFTNGEVVLPIASQTKNGVMTPALVNQVLAAITGISLLGSGSLSVGNQSSGANGLWSIVLNVHGNNTSYAAGMITKEDYTTFTNKIGSIKLTDAGDVLSPSNGVVTLPVATASKAGLMSSTDRETLTAIKNLMGNKDDQDEFINNLYDVIDALAGFNDAGGSILTYFNNRAILEPETQADVDGGESTTYNSNTFNVPNYFTKSTYFGSSTPNNAAMSIEVGELGSTIAFNEPVTFTDKVSFQGAQTDFEIGRFLLFSETNDKRIEFKFDDFWTDDGDGVPGFTAIYTGFSNDKTYDWKLPIDAYTDEYVDYYVSADGKGSNKRYISSIYAIDQGNFNASNQKVLPVNTLYECKQIYSGTTNKGSISWSTAVADYNNTYRQGLTPYV